MALLYKAEILIFNPAKVYIDILNTSILILLLETIKVATSVGKKMLKKGNLAHARTLNVEFLDFEKFLIPLHLKHAIILYVRM